MGSAQPHSPQRAPKGQSQQPSLTCLTWAPWPRTSCLACQYLLPPFVPSSGPAGLPATSALAQCHHPWAGPPRTQPGQMWDQVHTQLGAVSCASPPCPRSLCGVCQVQALISRQACPCFSSDWEINAPERAWGVFVLLWGSGRGSWTPVVGKGSRGLLG